MFFPFKKEGKVSQVFGGKKSVTGKFFRSSRVTNNKGLIVK